MGRLSTFIDKCTKWVVTATVFAIGSHHTTDENALPPYYLLCALVTAVLGKVLRRGIDSARPSGSKKRSPGMPSSHATSLSCLSAIAVIGLLGYDGWGIRTTLSSSQTPLSTWLAAAALLVAPVAAGITLTALRVTEGHHTVPQVLVGYLYGTTMAVLAFHAEVSVLHVNTWSKSSRNTLICVALACAGLASMKAAKTWRFDEN